MIESADMIKVVYPFVVEDVDRHGNVRIYFRRKGTSKIRIRVMPGTEAFERLYRELMAKSEDGNLYPPADPAHGVPIKGTWRWLCVSYFASSRFRGLDLNATQGPRRGILESTFTEPVHPGATETFAGFPLSRMTTKAVRVLRDRKADWPEAANGRVKAIRAVFTWALDEEVVSTNPARDVPYIKTGSTGFHSWTLDEVAQFEKRHPIGTKARLALALFLFTGFRRSDAARVGRQHARDGWFKMRQFKNRNRHPVDIEIPILPELQRVIDASPAGDLTYLVTEFGRPFSIAGLGNKMREWCDEAGLAHCSAHGLRKAGATIAAENGATEKQLMAIFGWTSAKEAGRYTRAANRKKLAGAAMGLLRPKT